MEIVTAWKMEAGENIPWLVSAYDEITEQEHSGTPQFYLDAVAKARESVNSGTAMRELVIDVPVQALRALFDLPVVDAEVLRGREL